MSTPPMNIVGVDVIPTTFLLSDDEILSMSESLLTPTTHMSASAHHGHNLTPLMIPQSPVSVLSLTPPQTPFPPQQAVQQPNSPLAPLSLRLRSRAWLFTFNNYADHVPHVTLVRSAEHVKFFVIGREVGESGTPHLQGYIYFATLKSLTQCRALLPLAHWTIARGTAQENYAYCTKDGNFDEGGVMPATQTEKGAKGAARIAELWTLARAGQFEQLPPQNIKTWEYIHLKYQPKPPARDQLKNFWIVGQSGTGKSRMVREQFPIHYNKPMSKWWDGYNNEETIVLDDFAPDHGKYLGYFLKIWADHYPFNAEVKGGMLHIRPLRVLVTSQYRINECFEDVHTVEAINRRFTVCDMQFGNNFDLL